MSSEFDLPAIPEKMQRMRDIAAKFLQAAHDEGFTVIGALVRETDNSVISLQNTNGDIVKLLQAVTNMLERKTKNGAPVIHDHVARTH